MRIKFTGRTEVEKNLNALGYHWERRGETIHINPEILNPDVSITLDNIKKVAAYVESFKGKNNRYTQKVMKFISSLFTPIKRSELIGAFFNVISVIILALISGYLFSHPSGIYSTVAISFALISLVYFSAACVKSAFNIMKSDKELLIKIYRFSFVDGEYTIDYNVILNRIVKRKLQLILISPIFLSLFILGIFSKSPLIDYLSEIFDLLGYSFAVFFLFGQGVRDKIVQGSNKSLYKRYSPSFIGLIFLSLLLVKLITHSILLDDFFLIVEFPLYLFFFIFSIYDVLRTK